MNKHRSPSTHQPGATNKRSSHDLKSEMASFLPVFPVMPRTHTPRVELRFSTLLLILVRDYTTRLS